MRLRLTLLAVLASMLISASGSDMMRLTVINKSGMPIAVSLIATDLSSNIYYTMPEGSREAPSVHVFTLVKDEYRMRVFWLEPKDPDTGRTCRRALTSALDAFRNMRVVVLQCDSRPETRGEPTMYKFGAWSCMW